MTGIAAQAEASTSALAHMVPVIFAMKLQNKV